MNSPITRQEMAAILRKYADFKKYDVSGAADLNSFTDANTVSGWAVQSMQWAVSRGVMAGKGKQLAPLGSTTRAETAAMLKSFIESYK